MFTAFSSFFSYCKVFVRRPYLILKSFILSSAFSHLFIALKSSHHQSLVYFIYLSDRRGLPSMDSPAHNPPSAQSRPHSPTPEPSMPDTLPPPSIPYSITRSGPQTPMASIKRRNAASSSCDHGASPSQHTAIATAIYDVSPVSRTPSGHRPQPPPFAVRRSGDDGYMPSSALFPATQPGIESVFWGVQAIQRFRNSPIRGEKGLIQLLVEWERDKETGEEHAESWEPEFNLQRDIPEMLYAFWDGQGGRTRALGLHLGSKYWVYQIVRDSAQWGGRVPCGKNDRRGSRWLYVQWVGYPAIDEQMTWVTESQLADVCPEVLRLYWIQRGL